MCTCKTITNFKAIGMFISTESSLTKPSVLFVFNKKI